MDKVREEASIVETQFNLPTKGKESLECILQHLSLAHFKIVSIKCLFTEALKQNAPQPTTMRSAKKLTFATYGTNNSLCALDPAGTRGIQRTIDQHHCSGKQ